MERYPAPKACRWVAAPAAPAHPDRGHPTGLAHPRVERIPSPATTASRQGRSAAAPERRWLARRLFAGLATVSLATVALGTCALVHATALHAADPAARPASELFVARQLAPPPPGPLADGLTLIAAPALQAHLGLLASPPLGGRGLGTPGLEAAAEYVATRLALAGVEPFGSAAATDPGASDPVQTDHSQATAAAGVPDHLAATGTSAQDQAATSAGSAATDPAWFQTVPLRALADLGGDLEITRRSGIAAGAGSTTATSTVSRTFRAGVDCRIAPRAPQTISAPVVFAGHGIREPRAAHDDWRGLDVRGKVVLLLGGLPAGAAWADPELAAQWWPADEDDRWSARVDLALAAGAAAVLVLEEDPARLASPFDPRKEEGFFRPFDPAEDAASDASRRPGGEPPLLEVSTAVADLLLADTGPTPAPPTDRRTPRELAGVTATVRVTASERQVLARNVVGLVRGADPTLAGEAIVIGAHLDHLGTVDGVVHPGTGDNASGTAAVLEIARAFAAGPPPRRSVVFVLWTGEEEGHLGSRHWVHHPRWPLAGTVAYLNLDMVSHPWPVADLEQLVADHALPDAAAFLASFTPRDFLDPGLPPGVPGLETALRQAAAATSFALFLDFTAGTHGGSDYRAFARRGIPFLRFANYFPEYHQPGDTPATVDPGQVERYAELVFATAWELANR